MRLVRPLGVALALALSFNLACPEGSSTPPQAPAPEPEPVAPTGKGSIPTCRTEAEVEAAFGEVCAVVGVYRIEAFPRKKGGGVLASWPVLHLEGGGRVMVESIWDERKAPTPEDVARFSGRRVEVVGPLHTAPPREMPENFGFPCVSPVQRVRALAD